MADLSYAQLEGLWMQAAGGTSFGTRAWAALMAAIAEAESGGNPNAYNPNDNQGRQTSWGLWQISLGNHQPPAPGWADPATNAQLALGKLQSQGLGAWGTYTSGAYKTYVSGSTTPDARGLSNTAAVTSEVSAAAASDCLWGWGGIPGTAIFGDIGAGGNGNLGSGCILTRSQARAVMGSVLMGGGALVLMAGLAVLLARSEARAAQWVTAPGKAAGGRQAPPAAPAAAAPAAGQRQQSSA